ncbi:MAG: hypothetical protein HFH45_00460 [Bacilli bacterium]|nr:hypothetical protein [Bacilli bacterium]
MNKDEIISILRKYNFNTNDYIVLSTGAMVIHGIKETAHDIDLAVSSKFYNELIKTYDCECYLEYQINGKSMKVYSFDVFDFGEDYFDTSSINLIDGIPVQSINSILKFKKSLNREKDIKDIQLIEEYINDSR